MDIQSLHYDFKIKMDRVDSLSSQDFNSAEIDWLLNEAQLVFIKRRYTDLSNNKRKGFEASQKRIDDLATLVVKYPEQPALIPTLDDGVYYLDLADTTHPYMFLLQAYCNIEVSTDCIKSAPLKFIQHDDFRESLRDPFNSPSLDYLPYNMGRSINNPTIAAIYIYPGDYTIPEVFVEYIKYPSRVSLGNYVYIDGNIYPAATLELPKQTHPEIVDIACELAALNIENPEYIQLKTLKVNSHE